MEMKSIPIEIPKDANLIFGQAHFIKTAEDLYEALIENSPSIKFGLAFCEASGSRLIRSEGNDSELIGFAEQGALKIGCGHSFLIFIRNAYPVNVLNRIKEISEVACVYVATANPIQVIVAENDGGRGVLGVIDGQSPSGIEDERGKEWRHALLRKIGYKK